MKCVQHYIKQGNHRSNKSRLGLHWDKNGISYNVRFSKSCIYETKDPTNQKDINKLFGLSFGLHHTNSARFGWRASKSGEIEILAYVYRDGQRINEWDESIYIGRVDPNKDYVFDITVADGYYTFIIKSKEASEILSATLIKTGKLFPLGYFLNPYFGGDETAPHTMNIKLCKIR
jgi:hypothetical protein